MENLVEHSGAVFQKVQHLEHLSLSRRSGMQVLEQKEPHLLVARPLVNQQGRHLATKQSVLLEQIQLVMEALSEQVVEDKVCTHRCTRRCKHAHAHAHTHCSAICSSIMSAANASQHTSMASLSNWRWEKHVECKLESSMNLSLILKTILLLLLLLLILILEIRINNNDNFEA